MVSHGSTQCLTAVTPLTSPVHPQWQWGLNQCASASSRLLFVLKHADASGRSHRGHENSRTCANWLVEGNASSLRLKNKYGREGRQFGFARPSSKYSIWERTREAGEENAGSIASVPPRGVRDEGISILCNLAFPERGTSARHHPRVAPYNS